MLASSYYVRVVDVMEELVKFTYLTRGRRDSRACNNCMSTLFSAIETSLIKKYLLESKRGHQFNDILF